MSKRVLVLDGEQPVSWNDFYSGVHWSKRKDIARRCHALVRAALDPDDPPFTKIVKITMTAYYAPNRNRRAVDASNITAKLYEDGLVGWWLVSDSPKYVESMTTVSKIDKQRPRLVIEVEEIGGRIPKMGDDIDQTYEEV